MSLLFTIYGLIPLLNPPRIHTDLLWDLGMLFGGTTGLYFLIILILRHRISGRRQQVRIKKRELAPIITNFLFFQQESDAKEHEDYIRMKIEIRDQLKTPINRVVLSEVLMDLRQDLTGEARNRVLSLYQELGLHRDAFGKLESGRWEKVAQGILELTEMRVDQAYHIIKNRINDKRSVIRKQAQLAIVNLREEGIRYVLDTARHRISEWQQLKLMELLKHKEDFVPPRFRDWLISENEDVVLFALRLIRHYGQGDASKAIITLLKHRSTQIQAAALECIREFRFQEARTPLKQHFEIANTEIKILILEALREIATSEDISWLEDRAAKEPSFLVRSKAGMVLNKLIPDSVLPTKDILFSPGTKEFGTERNPGITPNISGLASEAPEMREGGVADEACTPKADFTKIRRNHNRKSERLVPENPHGVSSAVNMAFLPEEEWTPEYEQIFAYCFLEELNEILSSATIKDSLPDVSFEFLPVVTEKHSKTSIMEPHKPIPEWLLQLDVQAEILSADSGYVKILREILLEDLEETGQVLSTDFVPGAAREAGAAEAQAEQPEMDPDFGVITNDIQQIHQTSEDQAPPVEVGDQTISVDGEMNYFSIFREFFRSYDRESKLILMDEIPEIGTEKELHFLQGLFEDPDEEVAARARKVYALLARRLNIDPKALRNRGSQTLWKPSRPNSANSSLDLEKGTDIPKDKEDFTEGEAFDFIPEFSTALQPKEHIGPKTRRRKNRLFRFFLGPQNRMDE